MPKICWDGLQIEIIHTGFGDKRLDLCHAIRKSRRLKFPPDMKSHLKKPVFVFQDCDDLSKTKFSGFPAKIGFQNLNALSSILRDLDLLKSQIVVRILGGNQSLDVNTLLDFCR